MSAGIDATRVCILGLGVDRPRDRRRRSRTGSARAGVWTSARVVIGHLANKSRDKGTIDLIDAMPAVWARHPEVRLVLAGSAMPSFTTHVARQPLDARILDLGSLDEQAHRDFLAAIDVFAMPSYVESFGLAALEAAAAGAAVVAYAHGGPAAIWTDGVDAGLVAPGEIAALGATLARLCGDAASRQRLARAGAALASGFTWDRVLARADAAYGLAGELRIVTAPITPGHAVVRGVRAIAREANPVRFMRGLCGASRPDPAADAAGDHRPLSQLRARRVLVVRHAAGHVAALHVRLRRRVQGALARADAPDNLSEFGLMLFAGITAFAIFSECVTRAPGLITGVAELREEGGVPARDPAGQRRSGSALFHARHQRAAAGGRHVAVPRARCLATLVAAAGRAAAAACSVAGAELDPGSLGVYLRDIGHTWRSSRRCCSSRRRSSMPSRPCRPVPRRRSISIR